MPAAAERPRPPQILPIREGPTKQSPPPYNKSPNTKSPPTSSLSSTTKPVLSPRTKKSIPSPPLEPTVPQFDKSGTKPPRSPSPLRPEPEREPRLDSKIEPQLKPGDRADDSNKPQDTEEKERDIIHREIFDQILELDEDDHDREFSREMVYDFFRQVEETFGKMDRALEEKDLQTLSDLGHFLKGSSAALGLHSVQASCEAIQHYGKLRDEEAGSDLTPQEALKRTDARLGQLKREYVSAEKWLKNFYSHQSS